MSEVNDMVDAIERLVDEKIAKAARGGTSTVPATYVGSDSEGKAWVVLAGADSATPVRRTSVEASRGDTVAVTVSDGMAVIDANLSDKSAGVASVAKADAKATVAQETAVEAIDYASQASAAASSAQSSADTAMRSATIAQASADSAVEDAARANTAAEQAISDAANAATAASNAQTSADNAATAASNARTSADRANYALSDVEKVVGTLNWIAEHGEYELTSDAEVDDSKVYYTRSGGGTAADPYVYTVVASPDDSGLSAYYELDLDESVQQYIAAHLWLDDYGLNLSVDSADGYRIHQGTVDGSHATGMYIIDPNGHIVQTLNAGGVTIGKEGESHIELDYHSLQLVDKENNVYFHVSDLRNKEGLASFTELHFADSASKNRYTVNFPISSLDSVSVVAEPSGITAVDIEYERTVVLSDYPTAFTNVYITYSTSSKEAKALTFGSRDTANGIGAYSVAEGSNVSASAICSHAEGAHTKASGFYSHAEGWYTEANGFYSHAEGGYAKASGDISHAEGVNTEASGLYSHAEGNGAHAWGELSHAEGGGTGATGSYSHAEGWETLASGVASHSEGLEARAQGDYSHAQNYYTSAQRKSQTVIGECNVLDTGGTNKTTRGDYALIIGNGTSDAERSNALTVDWDGNVECGTVNGLALRSMGEMREASGSASVATSTNTDVCSITLPAGTWLVNARLQYPSNATGRRAAKLSTTSAESGNVISADVRNAVSGGATQVQTERMFALGEESTVYLVGFQSSGSTLSCSGNIQAVRLSPAIGESYDGGGSGGGGTDDYADLLNKPSIEGVTLVGDRELGDFGIDTASDYDIEMLFR